MVKLYILKSSKQMSNMGHHNNENRIALIPVKSVTGIYNVLDRPNNHCVIIDKSSYSDDKRLDLIKKNMEVYKLKSVALVVKSESLKHDISNIIRHINPDEVITL